MTDPIADMLSRIRNAQMVKKSEVVVPYSKMKLTIAEILKKEKFVGPVTVIKDARNNDNFDTIKIVLKYEAGTKPVITSIKRVSTPGRRVYRTKDELPHVLNNLGIAIVSTSKGLMTNKEAKQSGLGGEIICEIY